MATSNLSPKHIYQQLQELEELKNTVAQRYFSQAKSHFSRKNYDKAIELYEKAIKTTVDNGIKTQAQNGLEKAKREKTLSKIRKTNEQANAIARGFFFQAESCFSKNYYYEAIEFYEKAVKKAADENIKTQAQNGIERAKSKNDAIVRDYISQADSFVLEKKYDIAIGLYEQAANEAIDEDLKTEAQNGITRAKCAIEKAKNSLAKDYILKADSVFDQKKYNKAIEFYKRAINKAIDEDLKTEAQNGITRAKCAIEKAKNSLAEDYILKSDSLFNQKKYDEAIELYEKAIYTAVDNDIKAKAKNARRNVFARTYISQAESLFNQKKYVDAIELYEKAINMAYDNEIKIQAQRSIEKVENSVARCCISQAESSFSEKRYVDAIRFYEKAVNIADDENVKTQAQNGINQVKKAIARDYISQADSFFNQKKYDDAIELYEKAVKETDDENIKTQAQNCIEKTKAKNAITQKNRSQRESFVKNEGFAYRVKLEDIQREIYGD